MKVLTFFISTAITAALLANAAPTTSPPASKKEKGIPLLALADTPYPHNKPNPMPAVKPPPGKRYLFSCGGKKYDPYLHVCYDDEFLCPFVDGNPTLKCGNGCYVQGKYHCGKDLKLYYGPTPPELQPKKAQSKLNPSPSKTAVAKSTSTPKAIPPKATQTKTSTPKATQAKVKPNQNKNSAQNQNQNKNSREKANSKGSRVTETIPKPTKSPQDGSRGPKQFASPKPVKASQFASEEEDEDSDEEDEEDEDCDCELDNPDDIDVLEIPKETSTRTPLGSKSPYGRTAVGRRPRVTFSSKESVEPKHETLNINKSDKFTNIATAQSSGEKKTSTSNFSSMPGNDTEEDDEEEWQEEEEEEEEEEELGGYEDFEEDEEDEEY